MKRLHFNQPNNLSLLHDELITAMPDLAPFDLGDGTQTPIIQLEGDGNDVWVTVPDDSDEGVIGTIVQAHDFTMLQPNARTDQSNRIAELLDIPRSQWTTAQLRELISIVAQILR